MEKYTLIIILIDNDYHCQQQIIFLQIKYSKKP